MFLKSFAKKAMAMVLLAVMMVMTFGSAALAAGSWPSLSSSKYCEFVAERDINVYRDSDCSTRGTSSPEKSYNASISEDDTCRALKITSSYVKVQYPTSSGYRTGYIKRSALFNTSSPTDVVTSKGQVKTYTAPGGSSYGSVYKGDTVYVCGTSGSYTAVIYEAKSGDRAYKLGYVKTSSFTSTVAPSNGNTSEDKTSTSTGSWQWPVKSYRVSQKFNNYSSTMSKKGRPYHCGMDIVSSKTAIYAAADGTVKYKGYTSGNGNHVIISHKLGGKTVYTLYSHLENYSSCPDVGDSVKRGEKIGVMGNTGNSTGTHLHFSVFSGSYSSDPLGYVNAEGSKKMTYKGITYYNPEYIIEKGKLP